MGPVIRNIRLGVENRPGRSANLVENFGPMVIFYDFWDIFEDDSLAPWGRPQTMGESF